MASIGGDSMNRKRLNVRVFEPIVAQIFPGGLLGYDEPLMDPKPRKILAQNVRRLMDAHGLSTRDLKGLSGLPQTTIVRILNERSAVTIDLLQPIAKAFQIPLWALLYPALDPAALPAPIIGPSSHAIEPDRLVKLIEAFDSLTDGQQDAMLKDMGGMADTNLSLVRELGRRPRIAPAKPPQLEQQSKPPSRPKKKP